MNKTTIILGLIAYFCLLSPEIVSGNTDTAEILTLENAQALALKNNPAVKNVEESIYQAEALIIQAWAILLPNIAANAGAFKMDQGAALSSLAGGGTDGTDPNSQMTLPAYYLNEWGYTYGYTANMTLFNARSFPLLKMAYANVDRTQLQGQHQQNELLHAVAVAYYNVLSLEEGVATAEDHVRVVKEFLRQSTVLKEIGQGTKIDVLRAQTEVLRAEQDVLNSKDAVIQAKTALRYLIGMSTEVPFTLLLESSGTKIETEQGETLEDFQNSALENRLDLQAAHLGLTIAQKDYRQTLARWIPDLGVSYTWSRYFSDGFNDDMDTWQISFGARWSILEGGMKFADAAQKRSMVRIEENNIRQLRLDILQEVEQRFLAMQQSERNLELAEKQLKLATDTAHLINRQYELGLASSLDVLNANTTMNTLQKNLIIERLKHQLAQLTIQKAIGDYHFLKDLPK